MRKILVSYFSVSGVTEKVAKGLAKAKGAALFQICPEVPYTAADLDWANKQSSVYHCRNRSSRSGLGDPRLSGKC